MGYGWLKIEASTPEKPEVLAITVRMGWDDADMTVGKLFRLWRWFDQQTLDGNAVSVSPALLDRIVGVTGFCEAVAAEGWLTIGDGFVSLPNFDRHNGETAKKRAQTAKRVAKHKANAEGNASANAPANAARVSSALPREEKRREEPSPNGEGESARKRAPACPDEVEPQTWSDWLSLRKAKKAPVTVTVIDQAAKEAAKAGLSLDAFLRIWCARGSQGLQADWLKPAEVAQYRGNAAPLESFRERDTRLAAQKVAAWTGGLAHDRSALGSATPALFDVLEEPSDGRPRLPA